MQVQKYKPFEQRCTELENRVALLSQEIERLNGHLRQKMQEIDEWKNQGSKMENQFAAFEQTKTELENRIALLTSEI